jgi:hypothetical protein
MYRGELAIDCGQKGNGTMVGSGAKSRFPTRRGGYQGRIDENALARLDQLPSTRLMRRAWPSADLAFSNFVRAAGNRPRIDRALMNGQWPMLLRVMARTRKRTV